MEGLRKLGKAFRDRRSWFLIGLGLRLLALVMKHQAKKEPWLKRALNEFEGVYRFESGDKKFSYYLILEKGRVLVRRDFSKEPDFTFTIYDPSGLNLRGQEMVLEIVIGNKIGQSGNLYYLYQFGFLMSLLNRSFRRKKFRKGAEIEQSA